MVKRSIRKKIWQRFKKSKEEFKVVEHKKKSGSPIGPLRVSILELSIITKPKKCQCLMLLFSLKEKQMSSQHVIAKYIQAIT